MFTYPVIEDEYNRWVGLIGLEDPYVGPHTVGIHEVLKAHFYLQDYFYDIHEGVGGIGPTDPTLLHSALARQFTSFGGRDKWQDRFELCATLFFGLIKNHPFHDCNKRTALLTSVIHLERLGRVPEIPEREYEDLAVRVADRSLPDLKGYDKFTKRDDPDVLFLAWYFRNTSRATNKRQYFINFQQLEGILKRFNSRLGDADGNFIHVQQLVTNRRLFGLLKGQAHWQNMLKIRFPGMKAEVAQGDLKRLRKALSLRPEDGADSEVFFHGRDSLQSYIAKYERPLRRLAYR